jgi:hypothetical protein
MEELAKKAKAVALKHIEEMVKEQIELVFDDAVELAAGKLKEAIPGQADDVVINLIVSALKAPLKAALLEQAGKIYAE